MCVFGCIGPTLPVRNPDSLLLWIGFGLPWGPRGVCRNQRDLPHCKHRAEFRPVGAEGVSRTPARSGASIRAAAGPTLAADVRSPGN